MGGRLPNNGSGADSDGETSQDQDGEESQDPSSQEDGSVPSGAAQAAGGDSEQGLPDDETSIEIPPSSIQQAPALRPTSFPR